MTNLSNKVLEEIRGKGIKPKPLWYFKVYESGKWFGFFVLLVIFGITASLFWFLTSEIDLGLFGWLTGRPFIYGRGPTILFVFLLVGLILSLIDLRFTKKGYRYNFIKITGLIILLGSLLAGLFIWIGLPGRLDNSLARIPFYQNREAYMLSVWQHPEDGRLAGEITKVSDKNNFTFRDFNKKIWHVKGEKAIWRHSLAASNGLKIKMIGNVVDDDYFEATDIRPWLPVDGCKMMGVRGGAGFCGMK